MITIKWDYTTYLSCVNVHCNDLGYDIDTN